MEYMNDEYLQQKKLNRKLKAKIWDDYRKYKDELRILKQQNKSLEDSIRLEQNKNREILEHFTTRISQLQSQIATFQNKPNPINQINTKKRKKPNLDWKYQELEEEGKNLQFHTEMIFKKCRESASLKYFSSDFPTVTNYDFEYNPIVISQPNKSFNSRYDYSITSSSVSSEDDDSIVSPIKNNQKGFSNKQLNDDISDTISTIRKEPNPNELDDKQLLFSSNSLNAPPSNPSNIPTSTNDAKNYDIENNKMNNQTEKIHGKSPDSENKQNVVKTSKPDSQLPSPMSIQTNTTPEENIFEQQNQAKPVTPNNDDQYEQIKINSTPKDNDDEEFLSQSGWDNIDNNVLELDPDIVLPVATESENKNVNDDSNQENDANSIPSMTNPILDSSTQIQDTVKNDNIQIEDENQIEEDNQVEDDNQIHISNADSNDSFDFSIELNDN